jgi:hypothetical protein
MKHTYRRLSIFVIAILIIAGGYFGYRLYSVAQRSVPQEFSEARSQGAIISEKIISNSNDIAASVAKLSSTTSTPAQASSTLGEVLTKTTEVHNQAIELAATLETMTKAVQGIRLAEAQQAALQAISQRLNLVSRLINYTDDINRLATAIRLHLKTNSQNSKEIANLIRQINSEVAAANSLSTQADESMAKFDALLR